MRFGIRYQLLLPLAVLLVGVIGASGWSARMAAERAEARVAGQVQRVSHTLANANYPLQKNVLEQMKQLSGAELLLIHANDTTLGTFTHATVVLPSEAEFTLSGDRGMGPSVIIDEQEYRCRRVLLKEPHYNAGGTVYIFYPESLLNEAIADAQRPSLLGFIFGLVAVGLTFLVGQRLVSRMAMIQKRTQVIAAGDFSPMPLSVTNDELRDLAASVNEMAQRLNELQATLQRTERVRLTSQLAAGLAHQLRNSVTGAKLALQVYLSDHTDDTEALDITLRQLVLMESNLRRFIDLGRPTTSKPQVCSLNSIITDVVELHRPRCQHADIQLTWHPLPTDVLLQGDANQLTDIVMNLLGNALDAAGPQGIVALQLQREPSRAVLEVIDNGQGPPSDVAARLFEPFVTSKPEGIGLGLAVARHAVTALGGTLDWRREHGQTIFRVTFPLSENVKS